MKVSSGRIQHTEGRGLGLDALDGVGQDLDKSVGIKAGTLGGGSGAIDDLADTEVLNDSAVDDLDSIANLVDARGNTDVVNDGGSEGRDGQGGEGEEGGSHLEGLRLKLEKLEW